MSLTPSQQFEELLKKTVTPLIILPSYPSRDAVATACALAFFLKSIGKDVSLSGDNVIKDKEFLSFIGEPDNVLPSITGARDFVLTFSTTRNKIMNVRTETAPDELRIFLTPENGAIDPRDFSFIPAKFKFDLAIVIGSPDKEHLGKVYEENPDIFYEVPIVNIDNHSDNELFGQVNLVDMTASSSAEMVAEMLERGTLGDLIPTVTESLLAGIVSATESFQKKNTTPKCLQIASRLMDRGADQQKIIRSLYKTQPLHLLKLWGRVMANVKWNEQLKLIWAQVSVEDLVQARASAFDLPSVLEKIRGNYSSGNYFLILYPESATQVRGLIKAASSESLTLLAERFKEGTLHGDTLEFALSVTTLDEAERIALEKFEQLLTTR
jgi:nanoRNase/pAp phosphatase (c-di-AMP/oligoRNAs hydrolase)